MPPLLGSPGQTAGGGLPGREPRLLQGLPDQEGQQAHDRQLAGGPLAAPRPLPPHISQVGLLHPAHQVGLG